MSMEEVLFEVEEKMEELEKALKDENFDEIKAKEEELSTASQNLFAAMYQEASQQQQGGAGGMGGPEEGEDAPDAKKSKKKQDDENVVDVDYEDVD